MGMSHMYLTAIIDWFSRLIVGWRLSELLDTAPVIEAVRAAIGKYGTPAIINSDRGNDGTSFRMFTSDDYIGLLADFRIRQSMDGKGRWADNVVIERFFRSLKVENIYIFDYCNPRELRLGISGYIDKYNSLRPHQSLGYKTPYEFYHSCEILYKLLIRLCHFVFSFFGLDKSVIIICKSSYQNGSMSRAVRRGHSRRLAGLKK